MGTVNTIIFLNLLLNLDLTLENTLAHSSFSEGGNSHWTHWSFLAGRINLPMKITTIVLSMAEVTVSRR